MPLLSIARFFAALVSLAILGLAAYLLWSWWDGRLLRDAAGVLHRERETWRLWSGLALAAWSLLGRTIVTPLLARRDVRPTRATRGNGRNVDGVTGASLYLEQHGPAGAPPLIFTHGWGMDSTFWHYAKQDLGDRFRLILWDLPGLGKSRAAPGGIHLEAFAAELGGLIDGVGGARPVLVGHSIGGMTIQTLLRDRPQLHRRLAGVVLLNMTYTNPLRTMVFSRLLSALQRPVLEPAMWLVIALQPLVWLANWQSYLSGSAHLAHRLGFGRFATRSQLEHATLLATRARPGVTARGNLAMFRWDSADALQGSPTPVLVVGGDRDIITKLEANRRIAGEAEAGRLEVVSGVNHMGPLERADLYDRLIADFALQVQLSATADLRPAEGDPGRPGGSARPGRPRPDAP